MSDVLIHPAVAATVVVAGAVAVAGSVRAGWVSRRRVPLLRIPVALLGAIATAVEGPFFLVVLATLMVAAGYVAWCYWSDPPQGPAALVPRWPDARAMAAPDAPGPAPAAPRELYEVELQLTDGSRPRFRAASRAGRGAAIALSIERLAEELDVDADVLRASGRVADYRVEALGTLAGTETPPGVLTDPYED